MTVPDNRPCQVGEQAQDISPNRPPTPLLDGSPVAGRYPRVGDILDGSANARRYPRMAPPKMEPPIGSPLAGTYPGNGCRIRVTPDGSAQTWRYPGPDQINPSQVISGDGASRERYPGGDTESREISWGVMDILRGEGYPVAESRGISHPEGQIPGKAISLVRSTVVQSTTDQRGNGDIRGHWECAKDIALWSNVRQCPYTIPRRHRRSGGAPRGWRTPRRPRGRERRSPQSR
jgi:hypothetical protein